MSPLAWFNGSVAAWFTAWGMNALVFAWLVVGVLDAEPRWVGFAQSSTMLPSLLFLLFGGAVADRLDPRRWLVLLHVVCCLPILGLAGMIHQGALAMPLLLAYGATLGTVSAFVLPARDTMLSRVAGDDMMRAVTGVTLFQFGGQALGTFLAGLAESTGVVTVLVMQASLIALGGVATARIAGPAITPTHTKDSAWRQIREGLAVVLRDPNLRIPVALVVLVGIFFIGPFLVLFPLIVRDSYAGGARELALVLMTFPLGTILGSMLLRWRGGIGRKGRALLISLAAGAVIEVIMASGLPYPGFVVAGLAWGMAGSIFINCSRTLVQEAAPDETRGRVLSAYQFGFVGGGPLGTLAAGFVAERIGTHATLRGAGLIMLACVAMTALIPDARRLR